MGHGTVFGNVKGDCDVGGDIGDNGRTPVRERHGFHFADLHTPGKDAASVAVVAVGFAKCKPLPSGSAVADFTRIGDQILSVIARVLPPIVKKRERAGNLMRLGHLEALHRSR